MRSLSRIAIGAGAGAAVLALGLGVASAEPPASTHPRTFDITAVGSDTTQNVSDLLQADYNATSPAPYRQFFSYDAVGSSTITTKATCAAITRPNGSGAGIAALKASPKTTDGKNYCVDIARSSRGPAAGDGSNGALAFTAFAEDAVTWSANAQSHAPTTLTTNQLDAIYSCDASILGNGDTGPVKWNELGRASTNRVVPVLPQSASGTRAFFLAQIGVTTPGSCVQSSSSIEENNGSNPIFSGGNKLDTVFPYSIAVYLAQSVHNHGAGNQGNLTLRQISGIRPTVGSGSSTTINPGFPLTRAVYYVVRDAGGSAHIPAYLQPLLGKDDSTGYICSDAAEPDLASYGFLSLGSQCGVVTVAPNGS